MLKPDSDMIETKPRIDRTPGGNRAQLFRAGWLSSARCSTAKSRSFYRSCVYLQHFRLRSLYYCTTIYMFCFCFFTNLKNPWLSLILCLDSNDTFIRHLYIFVLPESHRYCFSLQRRDSIRQELMATYV